METRNDGKPEVTSGSAVCEMRFKKFYVVVVVFFWLMLLLISNPRRNACELHVVFGIRLIFEANARTLKGLLHSQRSTVLDHSALSSFGYQALL